VEHHLDSEQGFLQAPAARARLPGFEAAHSYVCGPTPFMDLVESVLAEAGFDSDRIYIERFSSPADGEMPGVLADHGPAAEEGAGVAPEVLVVHLDGATHHVPYRAGQSILNAVRDAGLEPPYACEQGYCGSCAARRIRGEVVMTVNDVFDEAEVAEGHILTCQGRAVGTDCELGYED
jgi:3-ketosteroid 9alpha-monooxygenase subunit B